MTVSSTTNKVSYTATASQTVFAYTFRIFADADLKVYVDGTLQTLTTDYTVSGAGDVGGGNVTFVTGRTASEVIVIERILSATQGTDYVENDPFPADTHEDALDKLTMLVQQNEDAGTRSVRAPTTDVSPSMELPVAATRATYALGFDTNGDVAVTSSTIAEIDGAVGAALGSGVLATTYQFTGDGSTVAFTITGAITDIPNEQSIIVDVDGITQHTDTYTTSGTTVTFSTAPPDNSDIQIRYNAYLGDATTAQGVTYNQGGTGAQSRTVENKLQETVSVKDFGAVGDGTTDDTTAIQNAISNANGDWVYGNPDDNYKITSTLNLNADKFDGRGCTITKDFDGVGIKITGGSAYTELKNFSLQCSVAQSASDYDASGGTATTAGAFTTGITYIITAIGSTDFTLIGASANTVGFHFTATGAGSGTGTAVAIDSLAHGIYSEGTRVRCDTVTSSSHKGCGIYVRNTSGNTNKSRYININCGSNSIAGLYMDGYLTGGSDDMSIWQVEGYFQSNKGYALYAPSDSPVRQCDFWIYAESNFTGASMPASQYAVTFEKGRQLNIYYAYVEQSTGNELKMGANTTDCSISSVRHNEDLDTGSDNYWRWGDLVYSPDTDRQSTAFRIKGDYARVTHNDEYVDVEVLGSGGTFGKIRGLGNASGDPSMCFMSADENNSLRVNDTSIKVLAEAGTHFIVHGNPDDTTANALPQADYGPGAVIIAPLHTATVSTSSSHIFYPINVTDGVLVGNVFLTAQTADHAGYMVYKNDFYIQNGSITLGTPSINVTSGTPTLTGITVASNCMKIEVAYSSGNGANCEWSGHVHAHAVYN